jgi:hypothetical protein
MRGIAAAAGAQTSIAAGRVMRGIVIPAGLLAIAVQASAQTSTQTADRHHGDG